MAESEVNFGKLPGDIYQTILPFAYSLEVEIQYLDDVSLANLVAIHSGQRRDMSRECTGPGPE